MSIRDMWERQVTEIEHRTDMTDDQKVSRITHTACATCAAIAVQPIPFADIFVLTPTQAYFASRIAAIRGVPVSESDAADWIKETIGIIGLGFVAQQIAIGIWKIVSGGLGGVLTVPLVYSLTYAIMKISDAYFSAKSRNERLTNKQIKDIWKEAFREGKRKHSEEESSGGAGKEKIDGRPRPQATERIEEQEQLRVIDELKPRSREEFPEKSRGSKLKCITCGHWNEFFVDPRVHHDYWCRSCGTHMGGGVIKK